MLRITGYKKIFSSSVVLDIPHLELEQNIYWLRGENGSGKTTLLKSTAGLLAFDGDISVNNLSVKKQRRVYTTCVNHAGAEPLYPSFLSGNDLISFYLKVKKGDKRMVEKMATAFGMNSYLDNKVDSYSSGMTKKLCLLLAFIGDSTLILLDEPFTTLDVEAAKVLGELIKERFSNGVSFCISSHQPITMPHVSLTVQNKTLVRE